MRHINKHYGKLIHFFIMFLLLLMTRVTYSSETNNHYIKINHNVKKFMRLMEKKYHFKHQRILFLMKHTEYLPSIIRSMKEPFEKKPWNHYQRYFVSEKYIRPGVIYWNSHKKILNAISKKYGVDPSIIVAIIGIESYYGIFPGKYQEIGALSTLAFYYPPRSRFFKNELIQFLILAREHHLPTLQIKGSYAGALGIPQFMPSNYRAYGVNYSSQKVNLISNHADAIASIANYLKMAGWKAHEPVAVIATADKNVDTKLISKKAIPMLSMAQLAKHNIYPKNKSHFKNKVALIELHNTDSNQYWITFRNFRAIMRYNPNTNYAMAVYQLSRALLENYERQTS